MRRRSQYGSARKQKIAELICKYKTNKEIANELGVTAEWVGRIIRDMKKDHEVKTRRDLFFKLKNLRDLS
jgi:DNA-binding NarL/FixJ family response regulator